MSTTHSLPLLDLRRLDGDAGDRTAFLRDLRTAAREVGFFYLSGHGVAQTLEAAVIEQSRRFFALPQADKLSVAMINSPHFRGYNRAGAELTRGKADWREQFDIHAERDPWPPSDGAPAWTRLQGPNQWPAALPGLRPVLLQWQAALTGLEAGMTVQVLYWLHESRRDLVLQSRRSDGRVSGTFALRSPIRPNPIASSLVEVLDVEGSTLIVRGLDCIDGTPLLDVKPGRCPGR